MNEETLTIDLIFIGVVFWEESGSAMSPIYDLSGKRWDWGFVAVALSEGKTVSIRPATLKEKGPYYAQLADIIAKKTR